MMTQGFSLGLVLPRLRASKSASIPDFLTIFFLFQILNKTLTILNLLVRAAGVQDIDTIALGFGFLTEPTNFYRWQAEWVFFIGTVCFTGGWLVFERRRPLFVWIEPPPKILWEGFGVSILLSTLLKITGMAGNVGMLAELLRLLPIGALSVLSGGRSQYGFGQKKAWVVLMALLPLYFLSLQSGVKGEFFLVSMPLLLPIVRRMSPVRLIGLLVFIMAMVLVVFPISVEIRYANWGPVESRENIGTVEIFSRLGNKWARDGILEVAMESSAKWLARGASADIGGLVMQIADRDGHIGPILIDGLQYVFVPRLLWPDKPRFIPGGWFTWYLGQAPSPEEAGTSTAMMLPTEIYWMFDWAGVFIGMTLIGGLYAWCWKKLINFSSSSLIALLALFAFVMRAGTLEGTHSLYAIAEPIIYLVYVLGLRWLEWSMAWGWTHFSARRHRYQ